MSKRKPRAKWVLPSVINPPDSICIQMQVPNERYHIAAFRGALLNLASATQWADDPDHTAREVALVWRNVIDNMGVDCETANCCRDFPTSATFIDWEPQDPYTEPDFTPAGYLLPPFYQVTPLSFPDIIGYQAGDILTDISRIPVGTGVITEPESGWARFRVHLTGAGICTLQLLNVPLGGYALVTVDDNPLSASFVELNLDLIDLPPENNMVVGHERRFTTGGAHHIDVTFVPRFNDEAPAVFYGGGLRAITICGFGEMMFDIRQKEDFPCIIEKTSDGTTWVDAVDMQKCPVKIRTNNGRTQWYNPVTDAWEDVEGGDERTDGTYEPPYPGNPDGACLAAENIAAIYQTTLTQIRAGVVAGEVAVAIAATITGIMSLFIPAALVSTVALAITGLALDVGEAGLDDMLDHIEDFKCSVYCHLETDGSCTTSGFTAIRNDVAGWAGFVELPLIRLYLDGYGPVGLSRQGRAGGITTGDCASCDCSDTVGCRLYNFLVGTQGWEIITDPTDWGITSGAYLDYGKDGTFTGFGVRSFPDATLGVAHQGLGINLAGNLIVPAGGLGWRIRASRPTGDPCVGVNLRLHDATTDGWHIIVNEGHNFTSHTDWNIACGLPAGTEIDRIALMTSSCGFTLDDYFIEEIESICC